MGAVAAPPTRIATGTAQTFPELPFLLATGCRKGEALGLQWADVDLARGRVEVRRALVRGRLGTPKSGKARSVAIAPSLAQLLGRLLEARRREALERGWPEVPELVF